MKYRPEEPNEPNEGVPSAEPGTYVMQVTRHNEDVTTKNGLKDVIDFQGDNDEGVTVGATLWISGPRKREDGSMSKGTLWLYRRLAEAMGPDAVADYRQTDADGFSSFRPTKYRDRFVLVTVGKFSVDDVEEVDPVVVASMQPSKPTPPAQPAQPAVGDPHSLDDGRHDTGAFDDVPF